MESQSQPQIDQPSSTQAVGIGSTPHEQSTSDYKVDAGFIDSSHPEQRSSTQSPDVVSTKAAEKDLTQAIFELVSPTETVESSSNQVAVDVASTILAEQLQLTQQISALSSPSEIAALLMNMQRSLQKENKELRETIISKESRITDLSEQIDCYNQTGASFTCFSNLPTELRFKIWKYAVPHRRVVRLQCTEDFEFSCTMNVFPGILGVCKEARNEILRVHPLCPEKPKGISKFFNHLIDILYIPHDVVVDMIVGNAAKGIPWDWWFADLDSTGKFEYPAGFDPQELRYIAITSSTWDMVHQILPCKLYQFPKLEELIIYNEGWDGVSSNIGDSKLLFDCLDDNDINYDGPEGHHEHQPAKFYKMDAEACFTTEIDEEQFEEQWLGINSEIPLPEDIDNPWVDDDRTPPRVRIMRMVPGSATTIVRNGKQLRLN